MRIYKISTELNIKCILSLELTTGHLYVMENGKLNELPHPCDSIGDALKYLEDKYGNESFSVTTIKTNELFRLLFNNDNKDKDITYEISVDRPGDNPDSYDKTIKNVSEITGLKYSHAMQIVDTGQPVTVIENDKEKVDNIKSKLLEVPGVAVKVTEWCCSQK